MQREMEVPLLKRLGHVLARVGIVTPLVPQHHRSAAISTRGDRAFEAAIVERMILGADRQAIVLGIDRRTARYRPAFEHASNLEAEIPVQARRVMLLHDKAVALGPARLALGLGGFREVAFLVVRGDVEGGAFGHQLHSCAGRSLDRAQRASIFSEQAALARVWAPAFAGVHVIFLLPQQPSSPTLFWQLGAWRVRACRCRCSS